MSTSPFETTETLSEFEFRRRWSTITALTVAAIGTTASFWRGMRWSSIAGMVITALSTVYAGELVSWGFCPVKSGTPTYTGNVKQYYPWILMHTIAVGKALLQFIRAGGGWVLLGVGGGVLAWKIGRQGFRTFANSVLNRLRTVISSSPKKRKRRADETDGDESEEFTATATATVIPTATTMVRRQRITTGGGAEGAVAHHRPTVVAGDTDDEDDNDREPLLPLAKLEDKEEEEEPPAEEEQHHEEERLPRQATVAQDTASTTLFPLPEVSYEDWTAFQRWKLEQMQQPQQQHQKQQPKEVQSQPSQTEEDDLVDRRQQHHVTDDNDDDQGDVASTVATRIAVADNEEEEEEDNKSRASSSQTNGSNINRSLKPKQRGGRGGQKKSKKRVAFASWGARESPVLFRMFMASPNAEFRAALPSFSRFSFSLASVAPPHDGASTPPHMVYECSNIAAGEPLQQKHRFVFLPSADPRWSKATGAQAALTDTSADAVRPRFANRRLLHEPLRSTTPVTMSIKQILEQQSAATVSAIASLGGEEEHTALQHELRRVSSLLMSESDDNNNNKICRFLVLIAYCIKQGTVVVSIDESLSPPSVRCIEHAQPHPLIFLQGSSCVSRRKQHLPPTPDEVAELWSRLQITVWVDICSQSYCSSSVSSASGIVSHHHQHRKEEDEEEGGGGGSSQASSTDAVLRKPSVPPPPPGACAQLEEE